MTPRPLSLALIISTGGQDLKLWNRIPDEKPLRKDADVLGDRRLREQLIASGDYRVLSPEELRGEQDVRRVEIKPPANEPQGGIDATLYQELCWDFYGRRDDVQRDPWRCVLLDAGGKLLLRPAKIENLVAQLEAHRDSVTIDRILIFVTDRMTPDEYKKHCPDNDDALKEQARNYRREPVYNGRILGDWLAGRFKLSVRGEDPPAVSGVGWCNLMKELPAYEGRPNTPNHPLYRQLAQYADRAIGRLAEEFDKGYALVAATGGSCDAKACILASAELRFPGRSYDYPETEGGGCFEPSQLVKAAGYVVPTRSLIARGHCADRIRRGDLAGAWGTVAHLVQPRIEESAEPAVHRLLETMAHLDKPRIEEHEPWLEMIRDLDNFIHEAALGGRLLPGREALTARPGISRLLLQAFLVEAALRGNENDQRITEALTGLTGWVENALFHSLVKFIPVCLPDYRLEHDSGELCLASGAPLDSDLAQDLLESLQSTLTDKGIKTKLPERLLGTAKTKSTVKIFGDNARWWRHWLVAQSDAQAAAAGQAIECMEQYLTTAPSGDRNLRSYRNQASHGAIGEDARGAIESLAGRESLVMGAPFKGETATGPLWNLGQGDPFSATRFLNSPLVCGIFSALEIDTPQDLYNTLIANVLGALHGDIVVPDTAPPCP